MGRFRKLQNPLEYIPFSTRAAYSKLAVTSSARSWDTTERIAHLVLQPTAGPGPVMAIYLVSHHHDHALTLESLMDASATMILFPVRYGLCDAVESLHFVTFDHNSESDCSVGTVHSQITTSCPSLLESQSLKRECGSPSLTSGSPPF